ASDSFFTDLETSNVTPTKTSRSAMQKIINASGPPASENLGNMSFARPKKLESCVNIVSARSPPEMTAKGNGPRPSRRLAPKTDPCSEVGFLSCHMAVRGAFVHCTPIFLTAEHTAHRNGEIDSARRTRPNR